MNVFDGQNSIGTFKACPAGQLQLQRTFQQVLTLAGFEVHLIAQSQQVLIALLQMRDGLQARGIATEPADPSRIHRRQRSLSNARVEYRADRPRERLILGSSK